MYPAMWRTSPLTPLGIIGACLEERLRPAEKGDAANGGLHEVPTWQCDLQKPAMRIYVKDILFSSLLFSVAVSYENIVFLSHSCDYTSAILCFSITNSVSISPDSQFDLYTPSLFDGFH